MGNGLKKGHKITDVILMLPAFLFSLSILLVRLHLFSMPMTSVYWSEATDTSTLSDLFSYWKAMLIISAASVALLAMLVGYFGNRIHIKRTNFYIPLLIYTTFILLSLLFSKYKYFALRGMSEHFEGTIVLVAYIFMLFYLLNTVDSERRLKYVIYCAIGTAFLLGILGVAQSIGHDFFSTTIGQKWITPNSVLSNGVKSWDMIDILAASGQKMYNFTFTEGEVYQTVYNINYVSLYLSLLIPVSGVLFLHFFVQANKTKKVISLIFLCLYGLFLYNLFAANSQSGYFGLIALLGSLIIVFHKKLKEWFKPILCLVLVFALILGIMADRWLPEVKQLFSSAKSVMFEVIYADEQPIKTDYENTPAGVWAPIDYIETFDDHIVFSVNGDAIVITRDSKNASYIITDENGDVLSLTNIDGEAGEYQILDDRFHDYVKLSLAKDDSYSYVIVHTRSLQWRFRYTGEEFLYCNFVGKATPLNKVPHSKLFSNTWGTNRGRIWNTTIPMLPKYLLIGAGADTFTFAFPQNDYVTFYNMQVSNSQVTVTDKAHNLYLQYWVNTGLISLLAWLTMVGYYLVGAVKQFRKRGFVDFCDFVNGGIFCGICGFLAVAFFIDGSVNTMPMFYTMLGTGLAINMRDKWPEAAPVGETSGDGPSTGSGPVGGKKKRKKVKAGAEAMPEM